MNVSHLTYEISLIIAEWKENNEFYIDTDSVSGLSLKPIKIQLNSMYGKFGDKK